MLSPEAREALVALARQSIQAALAGEASRPAPPAQSELDACCGCFVTLKTEGQLRGCLGCFTSSDPLWQTVFRMTAESATQDPRFVGNRLAPEDLPRIHLDISVLSPLEPCPEPERIELGVHGIYVRQGGRSGCFLPQVATETGWSVDTFWSNCCSHKAGLSADAWRTGDAECFTFTAEVIEAPALP